MSVKRLLVKNITWKVISLFILVKKTYWCDICDKIFSRKDSLVRYKKVHEKKLSFVQTYKNTNKNLTLLNFYTNDFGEAITVKDIKEKLNEIERAKHTITNGIFIR
jgi:hypothetical protein